MLLIMILKFGRFLMLIISLRTSDPLLNLTTKRKIAKCNRLFPLIPLLILLLLHFLGFYLNWIFIADETLGYISKIRQTWILILCKIQSYFKWINLHGSFPSLATLRGIFFKTAWIGTNEIQIGLYVDAKHIVIRTRLYWMFIVHSLFGKIWF